MARKKEITDKEINTILELSADGCSRKEIANKINRSKNTVYRYQKQYFDGLIY